MKRQVIMLTVILTILALLASSTPTFSQPSMPRGLERLRQDADGIVEVTTNPLTATPSFIRGRIPISAVGLQHVGKEDLAAVAMGIVARYADVLGVVDAAQELKVVQEEADALGMRHVTMAQMHQGVEVYNAFVKVHLSNDGQAIVAIGNGFVPGVQLADVQPRLDANQAVKAAYGALPMGVLVAPPKLVIYPGQGQMSGAAAKLAWLVELRDEGIPARNVYVVDALNGNILRVLNRLYEPLASAIQTTRRAVAMHRETGLLVLLSDGQFPYGPNVGRFDVKAFLSKANSPLAEYADLIEERARWYSINPRLLLAILETQAGLVTAQGIVEQRWRHLWYPQATFETNLEHLSASLTDAFYARLYPVNETGIRTSLHTRDGDTLEVDGRVNAATFAVALAIAEASTSDELMTKFGEADPAGFLSIYRRLFPDSDPLDESNAILPLATPPSDMLQLPFAGGDSWIFYAGPHDWAGNDALPRAFTDFGPGGSGVVPGRWVAAAAAGRVVRHARSQGNEDCWVDIVHDNGWVTRYYHVANLQVSTGVTVTQNTYLGNPSELICNGGIPGGVGHVHFGIMQPSGTYHPISGTVLSGWKVVETGFYDGYLEGPTGYGRVYERSRVTNRGVCGPSRYAAEYFNNRTLTSTVTFRRCEDAPIAYDWGNGGPDHGLGDDNFSIRWTGWFTFTQDTYTFLAQSDDGIRIWLDGQLILNAWRDQTPTTHTIRRDLSMGEHEIKVEYYEHEGGATVHLHWWADRTDADDNRLITSLQTLWGTISPANDTDSYYFDALQGQAVSIWMTKTVLQGLDPYLILYGPGGNELARNDDSGDGNNAFLDRIVLPQTGRYQIVARSYNGNSSGPYKLSLRLHQPGHPSRDVYTANHGTNLPGTLARSEGQGPTGDQDVDNAYDFLGDTHRYYWQTHRRDSFDNRGATLIATVHYGQNYVNAAWDGEQMFFGDGMAVNDVTAHELTHGVIQYTANLEYVWQSGALNESFADIFGAMVDRDDWLMGEDLPSDALGGREAIRDLSDPSRFGQPAHTRDWVSTCSDHEGVHTNSGITNKAYHSIATTITKVKAERIFYRTLVTYLQPTSSLEDARAGTLQSAQDLYGANSAEYGAVRDGFNAVGLDGRWNPPSNDCTCAATTSMVDSAAPRDQQVSPLQVISTLYRVRDRLLGGSAAGQHYRKLYERHTGRISTLLLLSPGLRSAGGRLLRGFTPGLNRLADGVGHEMVITRQMVTEVMTFLQLLAEADQAQRGGELAKAIWREMARLDWNRLADVTFDQAWRYLDSINLSTPMYLPAILK